MNDLSFLKLSGVRYGDKGPYEQQRDFCKYVVWEEKKALLKRELSKQSTKPEFRDVFAEFDKKVPEFTDKQRAEKEALKDRMKIIFRENPSDEDKGSFLTDTKIEGKIQDIEALASGVIESVLQLTASERIQSNWGNAEPRINSETSTKLESTFSSFCIVGSPSEVFGDDDCAIILRREIMYHPDFYMLPLSAAAYFTYQNQESDPRYGRVIRRPHGGDWRHEDPDAFVETICCEKLSPAISGCAEALAYEWIARVHASESAPGVAGIPVRDIKLEHIKDMWDTTGLPFLTEGHLPKAVSRHYFSKIVLKSSVFKELVKRITMGSAEYDNSLAKTVEWLKDTFGGDCIVDAEGDSPEDVKKAIRKICDESKRDAYVPSGFTFNINCHKKTKEIPIPVKLCGGKEGINFYFSATRGSFTLLLSNIPDVYSSEDIRFCTRFIFTFCNDTKTSNVDVTVSRTFKEGERGDFDETRPKHVLGPEVFGEGLAGKGHKHSHFHVFISSDLSKIVLRHSGGTSLIDRSEIIVPYENIIQQYYGEILQRDGMDSSDYEIHYAVFLPSPTDDSDVSIWDFYHPQTFSKDGSLVSEPLPEPFDDEAAPH